MKLVIVESPTKARTLERFLGKDYQILATMGHIRDLPKSKLGVDVENKFKPQYEVVLGQEKTIAKIKKAALKASNIYLATDPDREGEAIAYHVSVIISDDKKKLKVSRITFHEITQTAIQSALSNLEKINTNLVNAQVTRRVLDRLVGYKLSPVLWKKIRRGLSAGRVQSVVVRLVVEREKEINQFASSNFWRIWGEFIKDKDVFRAELVSKGKQKYETREKRSLFAGDYTSTKTSIRNINEAKKIIDNLTPPHRVGEVERKTSYRHPYPPFTTSTMQQVAYRILGFSSRRTMRAAQKLYEEGLITYHRTDSTALAKEAVNSARELIVKKFGPKMVPDKPNFYKTKARVAQEAHEAIRPTNFSNGQAKINNDADRLYQLIWRRALASQASDAKTETIIANINSGDYQFVARGRRLIFTGFLEILGIKQEDKQLPGLLSGDLLKVKRFNPEESQTNPPPRYSEASLIATLEKEGIGRPSTYAPIISTIQGRCYVQKQEGKFEPTILGRVTNDFLAEHFTQVMDLPFTAKMEESLDEIANGQEEWQKVIENFYRPFISKVEMVEKDAKRVKIPVEATGKNCPECQEGKLVIRTGRFGKFLSCSRFPDCKYTAPHIEEIKGINCPDCGGQVVVRRTKKGRRFYGCSNYPKCKWASWRKPNKG
ncbi:MAG: type I DNA topoisomerase [Candidatus Shapirobacteria bacterium]|nr:type I DNA topoisomerase [Candidatus Shapirobacteria bacterium]